VTTIATTPDPSSEDERVVQLGDLAIG
jgi:hypothetical protein